MKILIIGDGKVGFTLAENLSRDAENDVTIIDKNAEALRATIESLDVRCIKGNGVSAGVLREAGVDEADLLVAATSSDEMNMVCCLTGKRLGARHTVARIRDPEYADELSTLKDDLELDMGSNPERAVAGEIARLLEFPTAAGVEVFARGRAEMVEIKARAGMPTANMPLREVSKRLTSSILIGAIQRGGEIIIPSGDEVIRADDRLHIVGQPARIFQFCAQLGLHRQKIKNVMIVGGGRVAYYLAKHLEEIDVRAKILEISRDRCLALNELLPQTLIIHGDGSDDRLLRSENLGEMDSFIAVTGIDEENLMTALLAKHCGVPKVVAKINRAGYTEVINDMGIDNLVQPKLITSNYILRYVRGLKNAMGNPVNALYKIVGGAAEAIEFTAGPACRLLNIPLKKLRLIKGVLVAIIARKNEVIIPHGNDVIRAGDSVVLLSMGRELSDLDDILAGEG
jgi:trk system potassium uptake protein TrkA